MCGPQRPKFGGFWILDFGDFGFCDKFWILHKKKKTVHAEPGRRISMSKDSKCTSPGHSQKGHKPAVHHWFTLQGTNIFPKNGILKMSFLFPRWDMLIPWRVDLSGTCSAFSFNSGSVFFWIEGWLWVKDYPLKNVFFFWISLHLTYAHVPSVAHLPWFVASSLDFECHWNIPQENDHGPNMPKHAQTTFTRNQEFIEFIGTKKRHTEVVHVLDDLPWKSKTIKKNSLLSPWIVNYKSVSKIMVFSKRRFNNLYNIMVFWSLDRQGLFPLQTPPIPVGSCRERWIWWQGVACESGNWEDCDADIIGVGSCGWYLNPVTELCQNGFNSF